MLADGKGMLFNTENTTEEKMILWKDRVHDFIKNSQKYGFVYDEDGAYICKKCLSDSDA